MIENILYSQVKSIQRIVIISLAGA